MGTLEEDQYTFFIISHSVLLRSRNVLKNIVEKIKAHILCSVSFFENLTVYEILEKYCRSS
jgi:hypothetical protein